MDRQCAVCVRVDPHERILAGFPTEGEDRIMNGMQGYKNAIFRVSLAVAFWKAG
jgi:hypothetical protein